MAESPKCPMCGAEVFRKEGKGEVVHMCFSCSALVDPDDAPAEPRLTGGSSDYYKVLVENPTSGGYGYEAECNDIIESLGMTFAEGNIFKAIWRRAAARKGNAKPGTTALYDAEKVVFFGQRLVELERARG